MTREKLNRTIRSSLIDMIYPPRCAVCEKILPPGAIGACPDCIRALPWVRGARCVKCGKPIDSPEREYCLDCGMHPHWFQEGRSAFLYEKGARLAVDRLKFYNRREYVGFFGQVLQALSEETFPRWHPDCLVPVPMHPRKKAERGYDQAALLAEELGRRLHMSVREDLLVRARYTGASKKLGRSGRRKNLRGAFAVQDNVQIPERIVLIDDIYTTGATMDEAGSVLCRSGVKSIFFLTLCIGRGQN